MIGMRMVPGGRLLRGMVRRLVPGSVILLYHRIAEIGTDPWSLCVSPEHFEQHLQVLAERGWSIPLAQLADASQPVRRRVAVSFDDGYADNLHAAKPLLEKYGVPATVFVVTGDLGSAREFWWDELDRLLLQPGHLPAVLELAVNGAHHRWDLGPAADLTADDFERWRVWRAETDEPPSLRHDVYVRLYQLLFSLGPLQRDDVLAQLRTWAGESVNGRSSHRRMTPEEVIRLVEDGLVEIGAHTVTHSNLTALSLDEQAQEIEASGAFLRDLVNGPVPSFSYPHGRYTAETATLVRETGFAWACGSRAAPVRRRSDRYVLPRVCVPDCDGDAFAALLRKHSIG